MEEKQKRMNQRIGSISYLSVIFATRIRIMFNVDTWNWKKIAGIARPASSRYFASCCLMEDDTVLVKKSYIKGNIMYKDIWWYL